MTDDPHTYPDPADFPDGDQLESLEQTEPADGWQPPADPDAEPTADGGDF